MAFGYQGVSGINRHIIKVAETNEGKAIKNMKLL